MQCGISDGFWNRKRTLFTNRQNLNKVCILVNGNVSMFISWLTSRKTRWKMYQNTMYYFCKFLESLKVFQNLNFVFLKSNNNGLVGKSYFFITHRLRSTILEYWVSRDNWGLKGYKIGLKIWCIQDRRGVFFVLSQCIKLLHFKSEMC